MSPTLSHLLAQQVGLTRAQQTSQLVAFKDSIASIVPSTQLPSSQQQPGNSSSQQPLPPSQVVAGREDWYASRSPTNPPQSQLPSSQQQPGKIIPRSAFVPIPTNPSHIQSNLPNQQPSPLPS